ncbi:MAG: hypothetical protein IPN03_21345 [Holophagales bacterium]|nr:hypothetical protein [Holophagales bacterium]
MSRPAHDDLIQGEIDGINSAADAARLRVLLAAHPDLDDRLGSLRRVSETLGRAERLVPPPGFVDGVMSAVRHRKPEKEPRLGWIEVLRSLLSPAPLAACACTLVLGVFLGGFLPSETVLSRSERAAVSGTALSHDRMAAGTLDRRSITREGITGEAVTRIEEGLLVLDLELEATRPFDVTLDLDGSSLSPLTFSQDGPSGGDVVMASGRVRFSHPVGRRRYEVSFGIGDPVGRTLRLRLGDGEAWDLSIGRERPR